MSLPTLLFSVSVLPRRRQGRNERRTRGEITIGRELGWRLVCRRKTGGVVEEVEERSAGANENQGHTKSLRERRAVLLVAECRGVWANICFEKKQHSASKTDSRHSVFDMSPKSTQDILGVF